MIDSFDLLLRRTEEVAASIGAFGYLNTIGRSDESFPGDTDVPGFELRFQPNPRFSTWERHRFGFSQRFSSAKDLRQFLDVVASAAAAHAGAISLQDADALDAVLAMAVAYRRQS